METTATTQTDGKSLVFSFGDPEPILNGSDYADFLGVYLDITGDYYRPPVDFYGLAKMLGANSYHGPILHFKKNMIVKWYQPNKLLSIKEFEKLALNYLVTGNAYLQRFSNGFGKTTRLLCQPALDMRRMKKANQYLKLLINGERTEFNEGEIIHLIEPDLRQSIYGLPEYLGGLQAVLLGEDSTLFRRKYYINGAHMGYILVTNDADLDTDTAQEIEKKVTASKGPGNFRSMYINIGRSNAREPVKVIPVGDIATKDEFEAIKNITEREMLAMHRMQPGLCGIIPQNVSGFGDLEKTMKVYYEMEVIAMQQPFYEINDLLGEQVVRFNAPVWLTP